MRLGVISDSHKNLEYVNQVLGIFKKEKIDCVIHLGDDYSDIYNIEWAEFVKVPGVYDPEYTDRSIEHRKVLDFNGIKILLTHVPENHKNDFPEDIEPRIQADIEKVRLVLHGHTHNPSISEKNGIIWLNPGHIKEETSRGCAPSYAFVDIENGSIDIRIAELCTGKEIFALKR
ncbi:MAG: YfcE family phosphodiesterase [Armatimonadota bacterium]